VPVPIKPPHVDPRPPTPHKPDPKPTDKGPVVGPIITPKPVTIVKVEFSMFADKAKIISQDKKLLEKKVATNSKDDDADLHVNFDAVKIRFVDSIYV